MTARATAIAELIRTALAAAGRVPTFRRDDLDAYLLGGHAADQVRGGDIRQPESVSPLALGPPTDPAATRDPQGRR